MKCDGIWVTFLTGLYGDSSLPALAMKPISNLARVVVPP